MMENILPVDPATLKNDKQREEWLANYHDWNPWYIDRNIGATYYRYDFRDGAALIVDEYYVPETEHIKAFTSKTYHLVGGPKPQKLYWPYHEIYDRTGDSKTFLLNFLKETKGGTV